MLRLGVLAAFGSLSLLVGCAPETTPTGEQLGQQASAIIGGVDSAEEQDFVLQLGVDRDGVIFPECSSTLIGNNLVLTARHCVGDVNEKTGTMANTFDADRLVVYVGADGPHQIEKGAAPAARGKKVITQPGAAMFPDLALIVLDRPIAAPIARIRLADPPKKAELVNVVGFGMNEAGLNVSTRMQKPAVQVLALAPEVTPLNRLHTGEFAFGEAACYGDSGGPALSASSAAVVGVASRVNSGVASSDSEPNKMCLGAENVYTSLQPFRALLDEAFTAAGVTPLLERELPPATSKRASKDKVGSTSTTKSELVPDAESSAAAGCSAGKGTASGSSIVSAALGVCLVLAARRRRAT